MRLARFEVEGRELQGSLEGDRVVSSGESWPLTSVRLLAPVPRPPKVVAVGLNYAEHASEGGRVAPAAPMFFAKARTCVIGPEEPIVLPPGRSEIDVEVEMAVVIGRPGFRIPADRALEHVLGFTVMNDVSDREAQRSDKQYYRAKSWPTFGPMGPVIATPDSFRWEDAAIRLRRNGIVQQESRTSFLIHPVPRLIELLSQVHELEEGDVILTGTPAGMGAFRDPPVFLQPGDVIECEIEGIGVLRNPVVR